MLASTLALWAFMTPGFRAPDEPQHLNSVMRVAAGGGWPAAGAAMISEGTRTAVAEAGFVQADQPLTRHAASALPGGVLPGGEDDFAAIDPGPVGDRSVPVGWTEPAAGSPEATDQMTQHPPGYYYLAAGVVKLVGALDWRWDQQLILLRMLDVFLMMWVAPLTAGLTRTVTGSRAAALVAAGSLVGLAQLAHVSSAVTNDALTTLTAAAIGLLAARVMTRPPGWPLVVLTGAALGLGVLSKAFLLPAIPVVALACLLSPASWRRRVVAMLATLTVAFAVGGWWWARNLLVHGTLQPRGMTPIAYPGGHENPEVATYLPIALRNLRTSFWSNFGWLEVPALPVWTVTAGTWLLLGGVVVALVLTRGARTRLAVLLALPALVLVVVVGNGLVRYLDTGHVSGLQGRYLFVGVPILLACLGAAVTGLTAHLPRVLRALANLVLPAVALVLGAWSAVAVFQAFYRPAGDTMADALVRWEVWSLLGRPGLAVVVALPVLTGVIMLTVMLLAHLRLGHEPGRPGGRGRHTLHRADDPR